MQTELVIKNYRCFPDSRPARISFRDGFTAFIGVNNSGKSSLLKLFYELRPIFQQLQKGSGNVLPALAGTTLSFQLMPSVYDVAELFSNSNNRDLEIQFNLFPDLDSQRKVLEPKALVLTIPRNSNACRVNLLLPQGQFNAEGQHLDWDNTTVRKNGNPVADLAVLLELFSDLSTMFYVGPFRNAINLGTKADYFDIHVGQAFFEKWKEYQTGKNKQQNEAIYNLTKDIGDLFHFQDLQIYPSSDNTTLQVFINGKSYKLPELGSGLTQFILVLANAAIKNPSYILIDEPELNLHPSLQINFLTTLAAYSKRGIVFGTHNLGLARASGERIYSLRRIDEGETEIHEYEATPRLPEFLGELSFSGYKELGFETVLMVEGSTDVKTVQQFLRLYGKDHKVVILPLGGSQFINDSRETELNEVKRITDKVSVLIDSERSTGDEDLQPSRASFVDMCSRAGIACHVLERRATENYLSERAVKIVKGDKYRALGPYEKLRDVSPSWAKEENWRIAREMSCEELDQMDLGHFLRKV
jgi:ABC-type cobalamin/Fe3+-siderophores transport system ATPase subunit